MNKSTPEDNSSSSSSHNRRLSVSFLVSLMVHSARQANRFSKKLKLKPKKQNRTEDSDMGERFRSWNQTSSPLKSPRPKELFTALSNKAMTMVGRKNTRYDGELKPEKNKKATAKEEEHGVWQREILMGGKCEPLDFSGVIYYDCSGRQLKEVPPRSPRGISAPNFPTRS